MLSKLLQPLKAKVAGKRGINTRLPLFLLMRQSGQVWFRLMCIKSGCGCSGIIRLEELLEAVEQFKREVEKEKEKGRG
jgi:hypothetical protein